MNRRIRAMAAVLVPVLALGPSCAASSRQVRVQLEVDGGPMVVHVAESGGQRVEMPEAELWGSFREAGREVVAQVDPLAAAEQTFELAEWSGTYRYYARSQRLVLESLGGGLMEAEGSAEKATRGYLEWCGGTRFGPGDCLRLLVHSKVLTPHGRYVVTLVMALVASLEPMLDSLQDLANPNAVAVTLASAVAMYLLLWLVPEPISKVIATSITVWLIGYVGLDLFWSMKDGWAALVKAADQARDFGDLRQAAREFGRVLGPQMGQILLLLVSHSLGKGLAAKGPTLPRFSEASAQAQRLLGVRVGAVAGGRSGSLGASVITISLASSAMAVRETSTARSGFIDPKTVRFSQDSIKSTFKEGGSIDELAKGLKSGMVKPGDVPPIRVFERDGKLFTLDNRRLEAFRRAGVEVPYRQATPEEVANETWKFTTKNAGESVHVRGE